MSAEFNKKTIQSYLNAELLQRIEGDGYELTPKGSIRRKPAFINSEFEIYLTFAPFWHLGGYQMDVGVDVRWKAFEALYFEYDSSGFVPNSVKKKPERRMGYVVTTFAKIVWAKNRLHRPTRYLDAADEMDGFIDEAMADYEFAVRDWLDAWRNWNGALDLMESDESLCGAWRIPAFWCLLDRVRGREAACAWLKPIWEREDSPEQRARYLPFSSIFLKQCEYLMDHRCGGRPK